MLRLSRGLVTAEIDPVMYYTSPITASLLSDTKPLWSRFEKSQYILLFYTKLTEATILYLHHHRHFDRDGVPQDISHVCQYGRHEHLSFEQCRGSLKIVPTPRRQTWGARVVGPRKLILDLSSLQQGLEKV